MNLTKKEAKELSIELWTWLAETGEEKFDWPGWERYGTIQAHCFLCEYAGRHDGCNPSCPYYQKFGDCTSNSSPFDRWGSVITTRASKKWARLFLEQLKQL